MPKLEQYLRELRFKARLSMREVAQAADVSPSYLSLMESGGRRPSAEVLRKLAPVYRVPVREMLEVAGYLDEPEAKITLEEQIEWAFQSILNDPEYKFGTRLRGNDLSLNAKRFIIEVYQATTGKRLL